MANLSPQQKISAQKYKMFREYPFYAYIADSIKYIADENVPTIGISPRGVIHYNPDFITSLSGKELLGVLVHEYLHWILLHVFRKKKRHAMLWNVATDIVINNMLVRQNFQLPKCGIIPQKDTVTVDNITIVDISKKSAEDIYNELIHNGIERKIKTVDTHEMWGEGENDPQKIREAEDLVKRIVEEAATFARLRGEVPEGVDRVIKDLRKSEIPWKMLLRKYITSAIKEDFTWSRPNKKYIWADTYLPSLRGETISVIVHIDTSGSISDSELCDFVSEIISISRTFENVSFRILAGDTKVQNDIPITPANYQKIGSIKLKGGGGTDHRPLFDYVNKYYQGRYKVLVCFTDGYTEWPAKATIDTIIVLCHGGKKEGAPTWAKVVRMKK